MGKETREPNWRSIRQEGNIEIRDYDPMIIAEVVIAGERYVAIKEGFRVLAGYIFGGNVLQTSITMTAPVMQNNTGTKGQTIAMTAPVMQQASNNSQEWNVAFVMPPEYTLNSLPVPNDNRVKIHEVQKYQMAVIRFSGFNTDSNLNSHLSELTKWLATNNIQPIGQPIYAFYNPPWTLPFLRRNEVMFRISNLQKKIF